MSLEYYARYGISSRKIPYFTYKLVKAPRMVGMHISGLDPVLICCLPPTRCYCMASTPCHRPNARRQARREAGAQRTLEAVACMPLFG